MSILLVNLIYGGFADEEDEDLFEKKPVKKKYYCIFCSRKTNRRQRVCRSCEKEFVEE